MGFVCPSCLGCSCPAKVWGEATPNQRPGRATLSMLVLHSLMWAGVIPPSFLEEN